MNLTDQLAGVINGISVELQGLYELIEDKVPQDKTNPFLPKQNPPEKYSDMVRDIEEKEAFIRPYLEQELLAGRIYEALLRSGRTKEEILTFMGLDW